MQFEAVACRLFLHYSYTLAQKASNYGIFCFYNILREFKKATGQTLHGYIVKNKLELCQKYIAEGFPITEVYKLGGFGGYNHFFRAFRQEYGMTPKEYYKATLPDGRQPQRKDTK